jgi:hypothetical protein
MLKKFLISPARPEWVYLTHPPTDCWAIEHPGRIFHRASFSQDTGAHQFALVHKRETIHSSYRVPRCGLVREKARSLRAGVGWVRGAALLNILNAFDPFTFSFSRL